MKEDELNFLTMEIIFYKLLNFSRNITALSGFLFIGTHCIGIEAGAADPPVIFQKQLQ